MQERLMGNKQRGTVLKVQFQWLLREVTLALNHGNPYVCNGARVN